MCPLVLEPLSITFNPGTSWELSILWRKVVVLDNLVLTDLLINTALICRMWVHRQSM
jgi:hypothetical protein